MAGLKKMKGKYYIRVRKRNGFSQTETYIPTKTQYKDCAITRRIQVEKYEKDIQGVYFFQVKFHIPYPHL